MTNAESILQGFHIAQLQGTILLILYVLPGFVQYNNPLNTKINNKLSG